MLRSLCVLRCAHLEPHAKLTGSRERSVVSAPSCSKSGDLLNQINSSTEVERKEAIERLSNEVFGCGNRHLKNVETLTSLPEGLHSFPEVCFIGKPNCGKSSLISCLLHNARLGKAGATGGTTRLLQFFNVGDALLLVDTPGYGGWKGRQLDKPLADRANAFSILFRYLALRNGGNLKRVYWLMEASARTSISFQPRDEEILAFLSRERIPFSVILTKIDRHWRQYADRQRMTAVVGKDGLLHPGNTVPMGDLRLRTPLPEEGLARNVREVFDFLGTDAVPILGVSANRKQPGRSRNIELVQHDIVHYCTEGLLPCEALTLKNLRKLSYAPPTADRIQEIQLRYPVESFVVPQNNNLSLARMVEQHEEMKTRFLQRNVTAGRLTSKDVEACHLRSIDKAAATLESEAAQRSRLSDAIPYTTSLFEVPSPHAGVTTNDEGSALRLAGESSSKPPDTVETGSTISLCSESKGTEAPKERVSVVGKPTSSFRVRPSLSAMTSSPPAEAARWNHMMTHVFDSDSFCVPTRVRNSKAEGVTEGRSDTIVEPALAARDDCTDLAVLSESAKEPVAASASVASKCSSALLQERTPSTLSLPAVMDPHAHYVTAIDGTQIPRSMISVSVEQLMVHKEDELAFFAIKSGAGAYEELLLSDHDKEGAVADPFTEADDFARLPEAVQDELLVAGQCRTPSAARKQEERFLAKYVEKRRKERSISMQAEGYMCPWLGTPEKRDVVRGLGASHTLGKSGAVIRGLKQTGFGGKSYSARTMKDRGRATKKTGSWAA
jgi:GTP-binding protein EngB required for normal cell division